MSLTLPHAGRVGERSSPGWGSCQNQQQALHYAIKICVYFTVPKSKNAKIMPRQIFVSRHILRDECTHSVLTTIDFDHQSLIEADEVDNKIIDRRLPAKMKSVREPKRSQTSPKLPLVRRQFVSEFSRDFVGHTPPGFSLRSKPPSPSRGGLAMPYYIYHCRI